MLQTEIDVVLERFKLSILPKDSEKEYLQKQTQLLNRMYTINKSLKGAFKKGKRAKIRINSILVGDGREVLENIKETIQRIRIKGSSYTPHMR